jgi:alpha-tubulin suppressor-like RCC1 family protein
VRLLKTLALACLGFAGVASAAPLITSQPLPQSVEAGEHAMLSVAATGGTLSYQWFRGTAPDTSEPVPGADGPLLVSQPLRQAAAFWVRVSDATGSIDSETVSVAVAAVPAGVLKGLGSNGSGQLGGLETSKRPLPVPVAGDVVQAATLRYHSLFVKSDGSLWSMGENPYGQLGDGTQANKTTPVQVATGVVQSAAGEVHSLFLKADGTAWSFGSNSDGQLGRSTGGIVFPAPGQVASDVVAVAAGYSHSYFLKADGSLWAAGANGDGQLGNGTTTNLPLPVQVATGVAAVAAGYNHGLFIKANGTLWAMGDNDSGRLGDGTTTDRTSPVQIATETREVIAGGTHSAFRKADGSWWGMGNSGLGTMGDGGTSNRLSPIPLAAGIREVAAGWSFSLWIKDDGKLWVTGYNGNGQLGDVGTGFPQATSITTAVATPQQAVRVVAGYNSTLFIDAAPVIAVQPASQGAVSGGSVVLAVQADGNGPLTYQWFRGESGDTSDPVAGAESEELAVAAPATEARYWVRVSDSDGHADSSSAVVELATAPLVSAAPESATVAWGEGGTLTVQAGGGALEYQWFAGVSGDTSTPVAGATGPRLLTPPLYSPATYWVRVSNAAGSADSPAAAITPGPSQAGSLRGFGYNSDGQLGTGDTTLRASPVFIDAPVISLAAATGATRYIKSDLTAWETTWTTNNPKRALGISAVKMACGTYYELYLQADGTLWGKGENGYGQLGDGTTIDRTIPVQIATGVADVVAGSSHTLILKTDGQLWGCGWNAVGQLGDGTYESRLTPVPIATGVRAMAAGYNCSHFIKTDGTLWSMGGNGYGQLGTGIWSDERRPVQIASGVERVVDGQYHSLFVKSDGGLWAMGRNSSGQTGPVPGDNNAPKQIASGVTRIAVGNSHSLYQTTDGTLWGLGSNTSGQLGLGATSSGGGTPVMIASDVKFFTAAGSHSLIVDFKPGITGQPAAATIPAGTSTALAVTALSPSGAPGYQWFIGQTGDTSQPVEGGTDATLVTPVLAANTSFWVRVTNEAGSTDSRAALVTVVTPPEIAAQPQPATIDAGDSAVLTVSATGIGLSYQWYAGAVGDTSSPVSGAIGSLFVSPPLWDGGQFWVRVTNVAGASDSAAATISLLPDYPGSLRAMGANASGQLGNGTTTQAVTPFEIANSVRDVAAGLEHTLYITTDGSLWAVGENGLGQLGDGSWVDRPVAVHIATDVVQAAAGKEFSWFLRRDGTLWGMGDGSRGQLGSAVDTTLLRRSAIPVLLLDGVARIATGLGHGLIVKTDGKLVGVGSDLSAQLGSSFPTSVFVPKLIATNVVEVAAGPLQSLFVKSDRTLWAIGGNNDGQLGDGTTLMRKSPVQVATDVARIAAGHNFSLHVKSAGTLWVTGGNESGQLGLSGTSDRLTWTAAGSSIKDVSAGGSHSLFLRTNGGLMVTGSNQFGQLGLGNTPNRTSPIQIATGVTRMAGGGSHSLFLRAKPVILSQPLEVGATTGQTPELAVTATGYPSLTYQWYVGAAGDTSQPFAGATATSFVTPAFTGDSNYWVRVTGPGGITNSQTISLKAVTSPAITGQPAAVTIAEGLTATLEIAATGGVLSYQWFTGIPGDTSSPVPGGTQARLETPPLTATTSFWVRVTTAAGSVDSAAATVTTVPAVLAGLGWNAAGQLGSGPVTDVPVPQEMAADVIAVSAGDSHVLLLKSDGTLWGAGDNGFGALGDGTTTDRGTLVPVASGVVKADAGRLFSLFLKSDGTLWGCGLNSSGNLGRSDDDRFYSPILIASDVTDFAAGTSHSLFVKTDGTLWATGNNFWGQLGDGTDDDKQSPVQIASGVAKVSAGENHSHFIKTDGSLWGMGSNSFGRLGDGTTTRRETPVPIATGVATVSGGGDHSLFVKTDGTLWAMGYNASGRLGDGTTTSRSTPVQIASGVRQASAGENHSLFVKDDGSLWACGFNRNGQLGDGTFVSRLAPVQIATGIETADAAEHFSVFLKDDGTAWAMGANTSSQFGDGLDFLRDQPLEIEGPVSRFAAGTSHTLFVNPDGTLWASGSNASGQLGDGTNLNRFAPVPVTTGVSEVAAGASHSLILKSDGTLWATGSNGWGQLGNGTTTGSMSPVAVASEIRGIAACSNQSAFIKQDGSLWRMGQDVLNYFSEELVTPTWVANSVSRVACGESHLIYLKTDGTLWVLGQNDNGQLGAGDTLARLAPLQIASGVIDVAAGSDHSLFVKADGSLWVMGSNLSAQLGVRIEDDYRMPVPVQVATGVTRAWAGDSHSVFLQADGTLWGMGYSANGALGDARDFRKRVPAKIASGVISASAGGGHTLFLAIGPVISSQPQSVIVASGATAPFNVAAFGPGPLSYQWFRGVSGDTSQPVAGADQATFSPPAANVPRNFWLRVSNEHADADSRTVVLAVEGSGDPDYQSWAVARGLSDFSGNADPDRDGSVNLIEYLFNSDPLASTPGQLPTAAVMEDWNGPALTITFRHLKHAAVTYQVERSEDLGSWLAIDDGIGHYLIDPDVDGDGTTELRRVFVPIDPDDTRGHLRLNILPK